MLLAVKVIGILCTVAVPASVCGTQAFLSKKQQTNFKKQVESEIKKTSEALITAHTNYNKEITRINAEKNELAVTKTTFTYIPVNIQTNIDALKQAKTNYESSHTTTQTQITAAIESYNTNLKSAQTTIEGLWTAEKNRVEGIKTNLDNQITKAKSDNATLQKNIETLKNSIETIINNAFYTAPVGP